MAALIRVSSERKGSNPGGKCHFLAGAESFNAYFKFCYGARIHGTSALKAGHQPIYEAITFGLVQQCGLRTTDYYVLLNTKRDVVFESWQSHAQEKNDPSGRDYYFLSRLLPAEPQHLRDVIPSSLSSDLPYLLGLHVGDIIGSRQNYACSSPTSWTFEQDCITYIDLGCSFVYAKHGMLTLPYKAAGYDKAEFKRIMHRLEHRHIISRDDELLYLSDIVSLLPEMQLPTLNPRGSLPVHAFLNAEEIREIQHYVAQNLEGRLSMFEAQGLLLH